MYVVLVIVGNPIKIKIRFHEVLVYIFITIIVHAIQEFNAIGGDHGVRIITVLEPVPAILVRIKIDNERVC